MKKTMAYNDRGGYGRNNGGRQGEGRNGQPQQGEHGPRKYDGGRTGGDAQPSRYNGTGKPQYRKPDGDKPYKKFDDNRGGDKPYKKFDDNRGGDKPYKKFDDRREDAPAADTNMADELPYIVMGRNAVREAVKSGRSIDRILVQKEPDGSLREIIGMAKDAKVQVREVERGKLDEICLPFGHGGKPGNHQGIIAQVPGVEYCEIADILAVAKAKGEPPFVVLLDGIEDPHNLGSIIRSADCAGAHGVIIPKRRSASVTAAACKASAGAVEYVKVARVSNLAGAIDRLKDEGLWMAGADMGGTPMEKAKLSGAIGLIIGGEGAGVSRLIKEKCDFIVSVPICGHIDSLNAAVAAAILMFEKKRQG